ncbi:MAG TPA: glutamine-hydrolyzing GMP synthase [Bacillota bacterium]|nr:glutamine-hydrolyzing GMP synthase [Bacillota bacterium]
MDQILVLDFGSQYNQLIVRRFREMGVYSELAPYDIPLSRIQSLPDLKGIVLSGGPRSVYEPGAYSCDPGIFTLGIPILGICYGMQWMARQGGGQVESAPHREYGRNTIRTESDSRLFAGLPNSQEVWMSHGDRITEVPPGYRVTAVSASGVIAGFEHHQHLWAGVQFHPEVEHTVEGRNLLRRFALEWCQAVPDWTMAHYLDAQIASIRATVGKEKVLMAVSGGVDSSVAATLLHRAIGDALCCVFIDHGLLRKGEADEVEALFSTVLDIPLVRVDAKERFLRRLQSVVDPETKRKRIGAEFVAVFEETAATLGSFAFLGQGTLYTDVIESGTQTAQTIKSHHNVGGLPEKMRFRLVEPLNKLFKDEVRLLGRTMGMPEAQIRRIPFPGPGLAIRILGEVTEEALFLVRESDAILREEFAKAGLDTSVWQYFTVLPGLRSVGVMGDQRSYSQAVAIRAVTSVDGMTADWARIPFPVLDIVSRRIVNEIPGINRILFDITSKPPATIEWE